MDYASVSPTLCRLTTAQSNERIIRSLQQGQPRNWMIGNLARVAWGASRAVGYLRRRVVDASKSGSRPPNYGKATLVTMAYDQRFAIA